MTQNTENIVEIDENTLVLINGATYSLNELNGLITSCAELAKDNAFLQRQNNALKLRCSKYAIEIRELTDEVNDLRFTHKYLTSEEAGKAFAQELLGGGQ